jgi:hypothetical protein
MAAVFALAPALVNPGQIIDYATPSGAKVYAAAIKPLSESMYLLDSDGLGNFLLEFDDRIVEYGWEEIYTIPDNSVPPILHMMTLDYGLITMEQINAHVATYIANQDRDCQNSFQSFNCLMNSLSEDAKKKINLKRELYTVNGIGVGPLLLKTIIQTAYVDTRSTVLHLREQLSRLDEYMQDVQSDVETFNNHAKTLVTGLNARGEQTLDLLSNLFKGYMAVSDHAFVEFIKRKKDAYEEGDINLTPTELMQATDNKFNGLKQQGRWNAATEQDEKIIALQAKVTAMEKGRKTKEQPRSGRKGIPRDLPTWIYVPPKDNEPEVKTMPDGKTYYWCANHRKWSINPKHTTPQCRGFGVKVDPTQDQATPPLTGTTRTTTHHRSANPSDTSTIATLPSLQLVGALAAAGAEQLDEEDE